MSSTDLDRLVDSRFGPITRVVRQPRPADLPDAFEAYSAEVADSREFASWRADPYAFGASLTDPQGARAAAIGEAIERYCGNAVPRHLLRASYHQLAAAGTEALDPTTLVLYSEEQYRQPGFPFVPFGRDLPVRWAQGWDLTTGVPVLVPASLVYLNYYDGRYASEPRTNFMIMPGIAAGPDIAQAVRAACAELVERDAITLWWQRGLRVTGIEPEPDGFPNTVLATSGEMAVPDYHLFRVPCDLDVPVLGALLDNLGNGAVTMGSACHRQPRIAAAKALTEAIQLRAFSLDLLDPGSRVWRGIQAGTRDARIVLPYRADRGYLGEGRVDFTDLLDFAAHAQLYLDPRMRRYLTRVLDVAHDEPLPGESSADLLDQLVSKGFRAVAVDLTTSDVVAAGIRVVRVIVPGLYANAPAAYPFLGGDRLYRRADGRGQLTGADLVRAPTPAI